MADLNEFTEVLSMMFWGSLFQSVIVRGKKDSFLYSVLQDGMWKLLECECRVRLCCGVSLFVLTTSTLLFTILNIIVNLESLLLSLRLRHSRFVIMLPTLEMFLYLLVTNRAALLWTRSILSMSCCK